MGFKFKRLEIEEVILIEPQVFKDERGYFLETLKKSAFQEMGIDCSFPQANHSRSTKGVLRGLHFQNPPKAQAKLVRVTSGEILDVAVDIRKSSPTYGKYVSAILSETNHHMLYIPEGFAHGFCVLSEKVDLLYSCSAEYAPETESGIIWNDTDINIEWPITNPIISEKDSVLKTLKNNESQFEYVK